MAEILARLPTSFSKARDSGDLLFFPSTVHRHQEGGVEFEIRLCPALLHKPTLPTPHFSKNDASAAQEHKLKDPFAPPYNENLIVGETEVEGGEYVVLLNKYSVVPSHFLLVTKEFASQSSPLTPSDLFQSYAILEAAKRANQPLFAFYNCGDLSGASQPHKHVQFIPAENNGPPIEKLANAQQVEEQDRPFVISSLPYANFIVRFPRGMSSQSDDSKTEILADSFMSLLDLVIHAVRYCPDYPTGAPSFNVVLTIDHLYVFPRRQENHTLRETGDLLSVNALGFAGMLLVKSETELKAVIDEGIVKILQGVAIPPVEAQSSQIPMPRSKI
ncbi:HIT-like protein [Sistotremastrum suecicum HHB10207 ss-3]|uniref:HIT-like protein n=1 Tax=Sistotremastrum suecicum HHB10207 ss-3 TaxID=1314776 RepID=A0A166GBJ1_9AGAM|nr:HIT-like protein [Sistotremastrum suecicum HHB10207 ss-3]